MKYICPKTKECKDKDKRSCTHRSPHEYETTCDFGGHTCPKCVIYAPPPAPPTTPTLTSKYDVVKPISIRTMIEAQDEAQDKLSDEFWSIISMFHLKVGKPTLGIIISNVKVLYLVSKDEKLCNWFLTHGFIQERIKILSSCPFCGSNRNSLAGNSDVDFWITCDDCKAVGPHASTPTGAYVRWNCE